MKKIVSLVFNEFRNDIRVLKENISFKNAGFVPVIVAVLNGGLKEWDSVDNIEVHRVKINYMKIWPFQLALYWIKAVWKYRKEPIFHCNDLYTLPIGAAIKIFFNRKAKIVYDCHEYETDAHIYKDKVLLKKIAAFIECVLIKYADVVITVSDGIAAEYQRLYNIPKPFIVLNCPNYRYCEKKDLFRKKFGISSDKKIVLYQGEYRKERGLEIIIEAFKKMPTDLNIVMVFLGYGGYSETIKKEVGNSKNIFIHETVGIDVYMDYVCSADFGIHLMENTCLNHEYALPNKIFEYAMAGLPVIVSDLHEIGKLVRQNKIGTVLKKNTPEDLIEALKIISECETKTMKINIQKFNKIYNWENQEKSLIEVYNSL